MRIAAGDVEGRFFGGLIEESRWRVSQNIPGGTLLVADIRMNEAVFQHRDYSGQSEYHLGELRKALKKMPLTEDLEAITVWWSGKDWYCIDGHHRLKAYLKERPGGAIPVSAFEGTLQEAYVKALEANSRTKLPMTQQERKDGAWRMVALGIGSKREQRIASGVSDGTVAEMRRTREALLKQVTTREPMPMTWWKAQQMAKGLEASSPNEDWMDEKIKEIAEKLRRTFGNTLANKPDMVWGAIEMYHAGLYKQMQQISINEAQEIEWEE